MRFGSRLLYTVGAVLGVVTVAYFGAEIVAGLSPEVKTTLLFVIFLFFLVSARMRSWFADVAYVLAAGSFLIFIAMLFSTFSLGTSGVFAVLGLSSVLFVALGYLEATGRLQLSPRTATALLVVIALFGAGLVVVDLLGPPLRYETTTVDELTGSALNGTGFVVVGETRVTNDHFLSRSAHLDDRTACLYGGERRIELPVEYHDGHRVRDEQVVVAPGEQRVFEMRIETWPFQEEGTARFRQFERLPVSTADRCPDSAEQPQIVIATGEADYGWLEE